MPPQALPPHAIRRCLSSSPRRTLIFSRGGGSKQGRPLQHGDWTHPRWLHSQNQLRDKSNSSELLGTLDPNATSTKPPVVPKDSRFSRNVETRIPFTQMPTNVLYDQLRSEGAQGHFNEVMGICNILLKNREEPLNKHMYNAVLHSFTSSDNGTAGKLRKVLEEMNFWDDGVGSTHGSGKIELDARGCECVLEALAVHPDSLLRNDILEHMQKQWFTLSERSRNFVVAGMLRERHFEHALQTLDEMVHERRKVEPWLFDQALWTLLEFEEVEQAIYVLSLKERISPRDATGNINVSHSLWTSLLDAASQNQMYKVTKKIWFTQVQPSYVQPVNQTCLSVLTIASRHGDVQLATDVFRVLTERQTILSSLHYELLVTTYLHADDLAGALSIILIMVDSKQNLSAASCHPFYLYLINDVTRDQNELKGRVMHAFKLLQDIEASGQNVPTAAVNACIQASIKLEHFDTALEMYKALHTISHAGPNTQTFNVLLRGCARKVRKDLALFLVNEMIQLGLEPDHITYDRLIIVCVEAGDLEAALSYYEEMREKNMVPRRRSWEMLILKCTEKLDGKAVAMLKDYKETGEWKMSVQKAVFERFERPGERRDADKQDTQQLV